MVDTLNTSNRTQSDDANANVNASGQSPVPGAADPTMAQFLAAQTQLMSVMMQNMNQVMTLQNQTAEALFNMMNQVNQAPTTTALMTPGSALRPLVPLFNDNNGGQPRKKKTSKAKIQCLSCRNRGHYANKCPRRRLPVIQDNIPEAILIATITPAAGGKNNRRYLSQLLKYRSLGVPMPQDTTVDRPVSFSTPNTSMVELSQKNSSHAAGIMCFNCREIGHYANRCPQRRKSTPIPFNLGATPARTSIPGAGRGVPQTSNQATGTPSTATRGRLNHVTAGEVQPVQNVVSGKFLR